LKLYRHSNTKSLYLEVFASFYGYRFRGLLNLDTGIIKEFDTNSILFEIIEIENSPLYYRFKGAIFSNVHKFKPGHLYFNISHYEHSIAICGIYKKEIGMFYLETGDRYCDVNEIILDEIKHSWYEIC